MYKLYYLLTATGEVGAPIDAVSASWSIDLNKIESLSITVPKPQLVKQRKVWRTIGAGGALLTYTDTTGVERPIVAGPVVDWGAETKHTLELEVEGIRSIFTKRVVEHDMNLTGLSYGAIAWRLVLEGMDKPGGDLPIYHASPDEAHTRQRTYERWNLANNVIDKRLTELSNVIAGPDIMFRPEYVDSSKRRIRWGLYHGTVLNPFIQTKRTPDFDTTTARGDVAEVSVSSTGLDFAQRVWVTGAGEGEGVARDYAENLSTLNDGVPFMETVASDADQDKTEVLREKAAGYLAAQSQMIDQVTIQVHAGSVKNALGTYCVGDIASVTLGDDWLSIPGGTRDMRIIKASGSINSDLVQLDFQENSW